MKTISAVLSPELISAYSDTPSTCVVVDILRASTTVVTAFENGARAIYPLEHVEEAKHYAEMGMLVGAERNVNRCDFAQLGNDPLEYSREAIGGKEIYFTTTNGTRSIQYCMRHGHTVLVGGFVNLKALAQRCEGHDILAVCAGWKGRICIEDALFAGALADALSGTHIPTGDATKMVIELWQEHKGHLEEYIMNSEHYQRLVKAGKQDSLRLCLTESIMQSIPVAHMNDNGLIELRVEQL
ncbi:MAG: 2-phosphosulfolactate phosphatase [Porphyromonas sp.]|nr:2-phosphosulfolactate phosphatase [Porphyromonas sp.]